MPRIYLDTCCLNRPFDDQTQPRIRLEAEAVRLILARIAAGDWRWIGSDVLDFELSRVSDEERRVRLRLLSEGISESVPLTEAEILRARELLPHNIRALDGQHIACAEAGGVDVFLTTDDNLLKAASRAANVLRLRVENPVVWVQEIMP